MASLITPQDFLASARPTPNPARSFVYRLEGKNLQIRDCGSGFVELTSAGPLSACSRPGNPDPHCQITAMAVDGGKALQRERDLDAFHAWNLLQLELLHDLE